MNGKGILMASRPVAYAVGKLSKGTLADILIDRIRAELDGQTESGEASDQQILTRLSEWLTPVATVRGDRIVDLIAEAEKYQAFSDNYRKLKDGLTTNLPDMDV